MSRYRSLNPFAITHSDSGSDSDVDSLSHFVTDLFENRSPADPVCPWDDDGDEDDDESDVNPFSGFACDQVGGGNSTGIRVVGFGSDSESSGHDEEFGFEGRNDWDDDERVGGLCWDSLCLEDHRSILNDWEEVGEERVNEIEDSSSLLIGEVEVEVDEVDDVDDQSVASGFEEDEEEQGEEALRYLEWEILLAFNNFERSGGLEHDDENINNLYLAVQEGFISGNADYDILFSQLLENESGLKGSPPAAKSFVENLPLVELTEEELKKKDVMCAICKDEVMAEEKVRKLPCSHCYHGDCILPWLNIRNTCPVCRFELPTDDADYEQSKVHRIARDLLDFAA
ncbi:E3 ubiquitin-protein ligase CIP8-like [Vicia villosa]|uniref:E3 ubiquitin-protein ligase CIP8-like n=1 Tax=Vicia villosa TaxID=3911 RepID=UPI00273BA0F5|nr:E3 ubiquitin-protein ligase CIP8-like [Vicia villosa]